MISVDGKKNCEFVYLTYRKIDTVIFRLLKRYASSEHIFCMLAITEGMEMSLSNEADHVMVETNSLACSMAGEH